MSSKKKCPICDRPFIDTSSVIRHIDKEHSSQIPENWSASRYENYLRTGKTHGTCVICKEETPWNEATGKYCRMCTKESCRKTARDLAEKNLMKAKGITHSQMLSDPDFQRKMIYSKKTSGSYKFNDGKKSVDIMYDSSYGKDFLEMLEFFMGFCSDDIMGPSPNTYTYIYDNKQHFYIPDYYIPSLNLEVEIKDGGSNPNNHPKIQKVDKVKESLKDQAMKKAKVNYVKVINKNYESFFKALYMLRESRDETGHQEKYTYVVESSLTTDSVDISNISDLMRFMYYRIHHCTSKEEASDIEVSLQNIKTLIKVTLNRDSADEDTVRKLKKSLFEAEWALQELQNLNIL